jgi:hypothetical protein
MLKVYKSMSYVSVDGADWRDVYCKYIALDKEPENQLALNNLDFVETLYYLSRNRLRGIRNNMTTFTKRYVIQVYYLDAWDVVTYESFNTLSYKTEYEELTDVSLEFITKYLPADQTIQYLKERGITACPMNF